MSGSASRKKLRGKIKLACPLPSASSAFIIGGGENDYFASFCLQTLSGVVLTVSALYCAIKASKDS